MSRVVMSLTMLAVLLAVGVADSQQPAADSKTAKQQPKKQKANVAETNPTDPGDPLDLSGDEFAVDAEGLGATSPDADALVDPAEAGKRMVIQGLGMQLNVLAARIRTTDDEELRKKMEAELNETVGMVLKLRKKYREERIARLEKLIATLRKQSEEETVEKVVKQLLSADHQNPTDPGGSLDDPAAAPGAASGKGDAATAADESNPDPADSKKDSKEAAAKKDKEE